MIKIRMLIQKKSVILNLLVISVLLFLHLRLHEYSFDDAYIHFRIAKNFYHTGEPYYNLHEAIQVSSSPAWTILLTLIYGILSRLSIDQLFPQAIAVFNALTLASGANIAYQLVIQILQDGNRQKPALISAAAYILGILPASMGLMETATAMLLAMAGLLLLTKSDRRGFILLGCVVFFRLELLVLWAISYLFYTRSHGFNVRDSGYSALGAFPTMLYELYYFKTLLPHTLIAKSKIYSISTLDSISEIATSGLRYGQLEWLGPSNLLQVAVVPFTILFIFVVFVNLILKIREKDDWWLVLSLWGLSIILGYIVGRAFIFDWYLPQFIVPLALSVIILLSRKGTKYESYLRPVAMVLFTLQLIGLGQTFVGAVYNPSLYPGFENGARVRQYIEIGKLLEKEYPSASLMSVEIGALGYSFHGHIHDAAGLASPAALAFHPMKIPEERMNGWIAAISPGYVNSTKPEIIVSYDIFAQALLNSGVEMHYVIINVPAILADDARRSNKTTIFESEYVRIYLRKDQPIAPEILNLGTR